MLIRPQRREDAEARAALQAACHPHLLIDVAGMREGTPPPPELRYVGVVAEVGGRIVGDGSLMIDNRERTTAVEMISVDPDSRRRGVGSAIHTALDEHRATLPVTRVKGRVTTDGGRAFAERRGFDAGRVWRVSSLDPRLTPPVPRIPEGIALRPLGAVEDLAAVWRLFEASGADMPGSAARAAFPFEDWLKFAVNGTLSDRDCSIVAYDGGTPVAFTFINSAGARAFNSLAGTARDHRGRGLGKLVKAVSLHKAAAKGVTSVYTANSEDNGPMLAVNTWLGYAPALVETNMNRVLTQSG